MRLVPLYLLLSACGASYPDNFGHGSGDVGSEKSTRDVDGDGYSEYTGDCDETDANINPGETELCDGFDNDCDCEEDTNGDGAVCGTGDIGVDDFDTFHVENNWAPDVDGDGYNDSDGLTLACDISSLEAFAEAVGGVLDVDEWSQVDDYEDADGDGDVDDIVWDCDDEDANTYPDALEVCDGADNDCDDSTVSDETSLMDTFYADSDLDGYGDASMSEFACEASASYVSDDTDCDDVVFTTNPGASEVCDGVDNDCDGTVDNGVLSTFYVDVDSDGYGDENVSEEVCSASEGYVSDNTDCDDSNADRNPGATEVCDVDDTDEDCDGLGDDMDPDGNATGMTDWYSDADGDLYAGTVSMTSCDDMTGLLSATSDDCDDSDASINPGETEVCDGVDNDCDATTEDETTWYHDLDGDGYGNPLESFASCTAPLGYVSNGDDCDDTDEDINPDATEIDDGVDNDCDGLIDSADDSLVCYIELSYSLSSAYTISEFNVTVSDRLLLDGDWYASVPSGVTFSATTGSMGTRVIAEFEDCLDSSDMITVDVEFTNGSQGVALDGTQIGGLSGWQDVSTLFVEGGTTDLGDGYGAFEVTYP